MIKLLIYGVLIYFAYRLFIPKSLGSGENDQLNTDDDGFTDYEEID